MEHAAHVEEESRREIVHMKGEVVVAMALTALAWAGRVDAEAINTPIAAPAAEQSG